jgi:hypothetical protein
VYFGSNCRTVTIQRDDGSMKRHPAPRLTHLQVSNRKGSGAALPFLPRAAVSREKSPANRPGF